MDGTGVRGGADPVACVSQAVRFEITDPDDSRVRAAVVAKRMGGKGRRDRDRAWVAVDFGSTVGVLPGGYLEDAVLRNCGANVFPLARGSGAMRGDRSGGVLSVGLCEGDAWGRDDGSSCGA